MSTPEQLLDANSQAILDAVVARVLQENSDPSTLSVVDVGCGEGRLLEALSRRGVKQLAGVGWEARMPEGVLAYNGVDLSQAGWSNRLEGQRFDWVVSTEVLEHLVNPYQFLVEIRKLVENSGRVLLTFPNVHNWRSILGYAVGGRFSGFFGPNFNDGHPLHDQHIFIPNIHLVSYFLKQAGLDVDKVGWVNGHNRLTAQTTMLTASPNSLSDTVV